MSLMRLCSKCARAFPPGELTRGQCPTCHREWLRQDSARRRAKPQRKVWDSPAWRKLRRVVLARDNYTCQACGLHSREPRVMQVHHVTPVAEGSWGDALDPANLITICAKCHGGTDGRRSQRPTAIDPAWASVRE